MMKRTLLNISLLLLMLCSITLSAIEVSLVASNAQNVHDMFSGLLPGRTPAIPEITRVRPLHSFNIYFFVSKFQTRKGQAHVNGSLYLNSPDGKKREIFKDQELLFGYSPAPGAVNLSHLVANWDFNNDYQTGVYTFTIEAKDMNNGKSCTGNIKIQLQKTPPEPLKITTKEIKGFITTFYKAPLPERLPELFNIFLAGDAAARKQKNYSPLPLLYGMARVLEHNPFVWNEFASRSHELDGDHKKYLALLFAAVGDKGIDYMIKKADRKTAGFLEKMKKNNPWQITEPYMEEDINALWMEFYFTGKSDPILKIANQLRTRPVLNPGQLKNKKGELTPSEKEKLLNYYSASSASWSLNVHASQHNLVFFYLEYMLENGKFADTATATKIQKILVRAASDAAVAK